MALPLAALVAQIENHLVGGTRGGQNYTYSIEQIADEITQIRGEVLLSQEGRGELKETTPFATPVIGVRLQPRSWVQTQDEEAQAILASLPQLSSTMDWHYCRLPELLGLARNPVLYIGPAGQPEPWTITRRLDSLAYDNSRLLPRRTPLVYVEGEHWWFTCRSGRLPNLIRVQAIFADPRRLNTLGYGPAHSLFPPNIDTTAADALAEELPSFPLSDGVWETVKRRVLALYTNTHTGRPVTPNDGTAVS